MIHLEKIRRRSRALTAGLPQCLQTGDIAAFNVVSGCALECHYCKYRARGRTPPDRIVFYTHIAQQVGEELSDLSNRRQLPRMVLFNTISDAFFGDSKVAEVAKDCLDQFFAHKIYVNLSTKGIVPRTLFDVLSSNPSLVTVTGSVSALSESFQRLFEPRVATAEARLERLRELHDLRVPVRGRIEPLIPMENDSEKEIETLLGLFRRAGVREVVIAYLQLDRPTKARLRGKLGEVQMSMLMPWYRTPHGEPTMLVDRDYRSKKYLEFKAIGERLGVRVVVCSCRNADIYTGRCFVMPAKLERQARSLL
jgi:DNA repair photolyase